MNRKPIEFDQLKLSAFKSWSEWLLLACGDFSAGSYNAMTIAWGSIGRMWERPFVQVVVRPTRYTYEFMERYDTFTVSAFSPEYKRSLSLLGTKSGRDSSKIVDAGITPVSSTQIASPSFHEAELTLECKKIYWSDLDPGHFLAEYIKGMYADDYHRVYFGEVVRVLGSNAYREEK